MAPASCRRRFRGTQQIATTPAPPPPPPPGSSTRVCCAHHFLFSADHAGRTQGAFHLHEADDALAAAQRGREQAVLPAVHDQPRAQPQAAGFPEGHGDGELRFCCNRKRGRETGRESGNQRVGEAVRGSHAASAGASFIYFVGGVEKVGTDIKRRPFPPFCSCPSSKY